MSAFSSLSQAVDSWAHLYSRSKAVSSGVTFAHLGGVLLGGGFAIAADRMTLRLAKPEDEGFFEHLRELHAVHRPVIIGLTLAFLSGLLMFAADVKVYLAEPFFWAKMAAIALLVVNGAVLRATGIGLQRGSIVVSDGWRRLRRSAWASALLWFGALFFGTALLSI